MSGYPRNYSEPQRAHLPIGALENFDISGAPRPSTYNSGYPRLDEYTVPGSRIQQQVPYSPSRQQAPTAESSTALTLHPRLHKRELGNKPAAEFDNFYTPQNDYFYSKSPYLPLDPTRREIRLLKVFPPKTYSDHIQAHPKWTPTNGLGQALQPDQQTVSRFLRQNPDIPISDTQNKLLACELLDKVPLSRVDGQFCALSYCAGSPQKTTPILVDGIPVNLFANLEHAINCAYASWTSRHPGKELLIWADQVCINQQDHQERSSQVSIMQDIYRRSCESFVCLSTPGVSNCLEWVLSKSSGKVRTPSEVEGLLKKGIFRKVVQPEKPEKPEAKGSFGTMPTYNGYDTNDKYDPEQSSRLGGRERQTELHALLKDRREGGDRSKLPWKSRYRRMMKRVDFGSAPQKVYQDATLASIERFMSSPWWRRAWVYQEFISSSNPVILSGLDSIAWAELSPMVEFLCNNLNAILSSLIPTLSEEIAQENKNVENHMKKFEKRQTEFWKQLEKYEALDNEGFQTWKRKQYEQGKAKKAEFQEKVRHKWSFLQSNEKKPSAFFSHRKGSIRHTELSEEIVEFEKDMKRAHFRLLHHGGAYRNPMERSRLYSRGPKLLESQVKELAELNLDFIGAREHGYWDTETGQILNSMWQEHNLETIPVHDEAYAAARSTQQEWVNRKNYVTGVQHRLRNFIPVIESVTTRKNSTKRSRDIKVHLQHSRNCEASDPRDRIFAFVGLGHKGYSISPNYSINYTIAHASMDVARKIIEYEQNLDLLHFVNCGRANIGYLLPTWMPDWTSRVDTQTVIGYVGSLNGSEHILGTVNASKGLPFSVKFKYDKGNDANVDLQVKGLIVDILNETEDAVEGFSDLRTFVTSRGLRVLASKSALPDDELWILHGSLWPVLLRPEGNDTYGFLGPALILEEDGSISSIMYGSLVQKTNNGEVGSVDIRIV